MLLLLSPSIPFPSVEPEGSNIGEEGFQRVKAMQDAAGKEDSSSERSRSSSKSDTEENSDPGLSIDLELPGIDVEIDESGVKVDAQGTNCTRARTYFTLLQPRVVV